MLADLVRQFGSITVYRQGLDLLGYPPTWGMSGSEVLALKHALKGG